MSTTLIEVRRAKPSDATAIASTHDDAWRGAYQGIIPGTGARQADQSPRPGLVGQRHPQRQPGRDPRLRRRRRRLRQLRSQPRAQPLLRRRDLRALSAAGIPGARLRPQAVLGGAARPGAERPAEPGGLGACRTTSRRSASIARSAARRWRARPSGSAPASSTRSRSPGTADAVDAAADRPDHFPADLRVKPARTGAAVRDVQAARNVFASRQAMVIGPTPPGTGVIAPATSRRFGEGHVADDARFAVARRSRD